MESGGVYFLLAHVLGQRSGGTVGILYSFGMVSWWWIDASASINNEDQNAPMTACQKTPTTTNQDAVNSKT